MIELNPILTAVGIMYKIDKSRNKCISLLFREMKLNTRRQLNMLQWLPLSFSDWGIAEGSFILSLLLLFGLILKENY